MIIIGLGHQKRTGKNIAASAMGDYLDNKNISYSIHGFADKLKDICSDLYGWAGLKGRDYYESHGNEKEVVLPAIKKSPRQIWLAFGTLAVRNQVYEHTWADYLLKNCKTDVLIIPDLRFPDEFEAIKRRGGACIKVIRHGLAESADIADTALSDETRWDYTIEAESGDIGMVRSQAKLLICRILQENPNDTD